MPVALPPTRLSVLAAGLDAPERVGQSDDVLAKDKPHSVMPSRMRHGVGSLHDARASSFQPSCFCQT